MLFLFISLVAVFKRNVRSSHTCSLYSLPPPLIMYTESQQYARLPQVDVLRTKSLCIVNATPYILHCLIHLCIFVWHNVLIIVLLKSKWNTLQSLFKKKIGQNSWLIVVAKWHKRQKHITQSLHVAITALLIKKTILLVYYENAVAALHS